MAPPEGNLPLLHRMLLIFLVAISALMLLLRYLGVELADMPSETTTILTYVFIACAVTIPSTALIIFKPRVPARRIDQSVEQYWSTREIAANASIVWFLLEGSGTLTTVGYYLTGSPILLMAMGLSIGLYWMMGPNALMNG
jgi:hypothetical protein